MSEGNAHYPLPLSARSIDPDFRTMLKSTLLVLPLPSLCIPSKSAEGTSRVPDEQEKPQLR